ncbi:MAG TPA: DUF389 domain-containing protein [Clostridia bacterium]|nr:DUF389 domain-containing protein [Clostridia bacterium]
MRQLIAYVPRGKGREALAIARSHQGTNLASLEAGGTEGEWDVVLIHTPNHRMEALLGDLQQIGDAHFSFAPQGVISLRPPPSEAPNQVVDVSYRSPIEIFLGGLQSIGSWKGFLGYAAASGVVAWIGLYTNTIFLLTAAMLIAPFAGPAMNLALGTARGDKVLIGRSVLRYFASLAVAIVVAGLLSAVLRQAIATELMVHTSLIPSVSILLPLTAGAAGALHLCQSERSSLVTAAGTGMLVAASLAPPAAIIGMGAVLGEWSMVKGSAFLLLLQLVGINLAGAIVFALFGLSPKGVRFERGQNWLRWSSLGVTTLAMGALMAWQFWQPPDLQRSGRAQRAASEVKQAINSSPLAQVVETNVRFTRADIPNQNSLLIVAYVQRRPGVEAPDAAIKQDLTFRIRQSIEKQGFNVTPLVDVTVLEGF